ncbi:MAG: IclR family transcriptional regulator [Asticcacaulis sp.]
MKKENDTGKSANPSAEGSQGKAKYAAPALEKGFRVIELLATHPAGLTASEIAAGLSFSVSEIFRIIIVMERMEWLRKGAGDKYSVTPKVLALAFRATPAEELSALALPHMRELSNMTDQSCHLVIRNGDKGLVIARFQNPGPTGFHVRIGSEIDLKTSCSGHVLLAFCHEARTPDEVTEAERPFAAILHAARQRGYERMESARTLGVTDMSYPIFDMHGEVAGALTVPFLRRIDGDQVYSLDETRELLGRAAKAVSDELAAGKRR